CFSLSFPSPSSPSSQSSWLPTTPPPSPRLSTSSQPALTIGRPSPTPLLRRPTNATPDARVSRPRPTPSVLRCPPSKAAATAARPRRHHCVACWAWRSGRGSVSAIPAEEREKMKGGKDPGVRCSRRSRGCLSTGVLGEGWRAGLLGLRRGRGRVISWRCGRILRIGRRCRRRRTRMESTQITVEGGRMVFEIPWERRQEVRGG
ncbi:hypothetical protein EX30DRAFT_380676, partial [Ascodesmis nigricans]